VSTSSERGVDARESEPAPPLGTPGQPIPIRAIEAIGLSGGVLRTLASLLLLASLVGRGLAPALRGARAGIGRFIERAQFAGELLTQLAVFAGAMIAVRLAFATLRERRLGVVYRLISVPASATIVTLVVASSARQLDLGLGLTLGLTAATLALAASVPALMAAPTRAAGFVLALAGAATLAHLLAGFLAVRASERALVGLFSVARAIATLSFTFDVASLLVAGIWVTARRWLPAAIAATCLIGGALFLAWGAQRGSHYDAPLWQVLAGRILAQVSPQPAPLVGVLVRYWTETLALLTAAAVLVSRSRPPALSAAVALAILARASGEIPALGLALALSALLSALTSVDTRGAPESEAPTAKSLVRSHGEA
jgi:hypothetical protein